MSKQESSISILVVIEQSFPTSRSVFSVESSLSTSGELIPSATAGIVIPSNGELGGVEFGVVDSDPTI